MVVLDEFYEISERQTPRVNSKWKVIHVLLFIIIAISGILTTFEFGSIMNDFSNFCIIGSDLTFDNPEDVPTATESTITTSTEIGISENKTDDQLMTVNNGTESPLNITTIKIPNAESRESDDDRNRTVWKIDLTYSIWGSAESCQFPQFTPITSMISAIVWGTFFIIVARGGAGNPNDFIQTPWSLIYPCMAFSLVFSIILAISNTSMSTGIENFCAQFNREFGQKECSSLIDLHTIQFNGSEKAFYTHYRIVIITAYISLFSWLTQLGLLIARVICVVDFDIHHVKVSDKEEEYVQHVIEYHDEDDTSTSQV